MRKILQANIKTIDDKNHIRFFNKLDIDLDSIVFKCDKPLPDTIVPTLNNDSNAYFTFNTNSDGATLTSTVDTGDDNTSEIPSKTKNKSKKNKNKSTKK